MKPIENMRQSISLDSLASIDDTQSGELPAGARSLLLGFIHSHGDFAALRSELQRIAEQIINNLLQTQFVRRHWQFHSRSKIARDNPFFSANGLCAATACWTTFTDR